MIDPETQSRLLDGARNLVRYVEINSQQQVLIHTEPGFDDPDVVGAVKSAIEEIGAQVSVLHTPHWDKQYEPPPRAFEAAIEGCDVLIGQGEYLHTKNHTSKSVCSNGDSSTSITKRKRWKRSLHGTDAFPPNCCSPSVSSRWSASALARIFE
jgi:hypothetical protein